jgi:acyl carrier protein
MTPDEIRTVLLEEIGNIAPEADLSMVRPDADLREELDIDSISFLNLIIALGHRLGINVPEKDYSKLGTLNSAVAYLIKFTAAVPN